MASNRTKTNLLTIMLILLVGSTLYIYRLQEGCTGIFACVALNVVNSDSVKGGKTEDMSVDDLIDFIDARTLDERKNRIQPVSTTKSSQHENTYMESRDWNITDRDSRIPSHSSGYGFKCEKQEHIYFLKVHKAGSTTVQNLFLRFAMEHKLNVLTPKANRMESLILKTPGEPPRRPERLVNGKYDIFCEHSIYTKGLMAKLQNDTVNIAILREPMSHLRSVFNYFSLPRAMNLQNARAPVAAFLENPRHYESKCPATNRKFLQGLFAREFGFNPSVHSLQQYVTYIDSKFLVLILEYLPESMILLKRKLCWTMKDVIYFHAKERNYSKPTTNETLAKLHKSWNPLDYTFYDHFVQVINKSIANQPNNFQGEVVLFKKYLRRTRAFCADICSRLGHLVREKAARPMIQLVLDDSEYFEGSHWEGSFNVSGVDCLLMTLSNLNLRPALDIQLSPESCVKQTRNTLEVNPAYCHDHFAYTLPWSVLSQPHFHTACYTV